MTTERLIEITDDQLDEMVRVLLSDGQEHTAEEITMTLQRLAEDPVMTTAGRMQ